MPYSYRLTPLAEADLDETLGYLSGKLDSPAAALNLLHDVIAAMETACLMPYANPNCEHSFIQDSAYRHVRVRNYILVYRVNEKTGTIEVLRFLYARRDISKQDISGRAS